MTTATFGIAGGSLYDPDMATTELLGVEETRKALSTRIKTAANEEIHTVVTLHGQPYAVLVDVGWYAKARRALGDPTDMRIPVKPSESD